MILRRSAALFATAVFLAGCSINPATFEPHAVAKSLREARGEGASTEEQVAHYLQAAATAAPQIGAGDSATPARETYNTAAADLTVLLRNAEGGRLWNHPLAVSAGGSNYRLRFQPGSKQGVWAPDFFTSLALPRAMPAKIITHPDRQEGVGGALVGIRKKEPREPFAPFAGITALVTATLDFQGHDATLTLRDPVKQPTAHVAGVERPLAADFSAPLAYYPAPSETLTGLMGALRVSNFMDQTGLFMMQPYDPDRIPVILVHGLISTGRMWRNVANDIEKDPVLRGRYQFWAFNYPTGNPVVYSALRLREELAKEEKLHGFPHGFVLVGHSMGGIVSRMQVSTFDRAAWERGAPGIAGKLFSTVPKDSLLYRAGVFDANPKVRRVVFICTPHRGSNMATGGIGAIAMRLIALPGDLTSTITKSLGNSLADVTGSAKRVPNSIFSLSPGNPTLKVMDKIPIRAPHHSIIGDQGKGDSPNSSDGVVPYWSSHLDSAQSEKIVPGPHGSCELPETIEELQRILHLHLKTASR
ncbi:MAG: alpha/beta fold hydrolase [Chthoniobacter sp.]|nr:alpha/beta fold hydrolase [Chthoniobacter sp.]